MKVFRSYRVLSCARLSRKRNHYDDLTFMNNQSEVDSCKPS